jgi:hypothetical protein
VWRQRLSEVDDDMETKLLRSQQAELPFTLQVPDKASLGGAGRRHLLAAMAAIVAVAAGTTLPGN